MLGLRSGPGAGAKEQEQRGERAGFRSRMRLFGSWFQVLSALNSASRFWSFACAGGVSPRGSMSSVALPGRRVSRLKGAVVAAADIRAPISLFPAAAFCVVLREVIFDGVISREDDL